MCLCTVITNIHETNLLIYIHAYVPSNDSEEDDDDRLPVHYVQMTDNKTDHV
jgi:hypothetical protein